MPDGSKDAKISPKFNWRQSDSNCLYCMFSPKGLSHGSHNAIHACL